jgi:hypothetical protein
LALWIGQRSIESLFHFKDLIAEGLGYTKNETQNNIGHQMAKTILAWFEDEAIRNLWADFVLDMVITSTELSEQDINELNYVYSFLVNFPSY